jgi:arsenate reductase (thioredoxin)
MNARRPYNVLFLCTANSARSILAESILNRVGGERFRGYSAGSHPKGEVDPAVLELLASLGLPAAGLRSKGWDEFAAPDSPEMDFVITVCDSAAGEKCPVWPGNPATAHWGVPDPAGEAGSEVERKNAFRSAYRRLEHRIRLFTSLRIEDLDGLALGRKLAEIGKSLE